MNDLLIDTSSQDFFKKFQKCLRIKGFTHLMNEFPSTNVHRSKDACMETSWLLKNDWVFFFRRDPHNASGSVLLEMTFISRPNFDLFLPV